MNHIYLRRRARLYIQAGDGSATLGHIAIVQKEAEQLGFVLSDEVIERLGTLSIDALAQFSRSLIKDLRSMTGAHRKHVPLYPDFPQQVLALPEARLYINAVRHYLDLRRMPGTGAVRPPLLHGKAPRELRLGSLDDFESIFTRLAASRSSLSPQDKDDLAWFIRQYGQNIFRLLPARIPFKENLALIGAWLLRQAPGEAAESFLRGQIKTATDVLRLAVALADGDVSLQKATKFKSLRRPMRRLLLSLVEASTEPAQDMRRWSERWKRLGEVLHPGEYAQRFAQAAAAFAIVRNDQPLGNFNSSIETLLGVRQAEAAARQLQRRPGEFARRLDHLLRLSEDPASILDGFAQIADRISSPVLLQTLVHFRTRGHNPLRAFFPKGEVAKVFAIQDTRTALTSEWTRKAALICDTALRARFAQLPALGACYIDPVLRDYLVPFSQRSASRSLRTLVRGSRLPLPQARFIRLFLWWMNGRQRTDIDLSTVLFGPDFEYVDTVAYYNLRHYGGHHSGDIVDAPQGAAEFIDLDLERLRQNKKKVRFIVMVLNSYTLQPYCDLPECFAGWMARQDIDSGEIFEPRTVQDRIDLASDTQISLPLALDLERGCILWLDIALKTQPRWNNVHNNLSGVALMLRAFSGLGKPDLFTLFQLHAQARGTLVDSPQEAQTVFSPGDGITPFDLDRIRAEFL